MYLSPMEGLTRCDLMAATGEHCVILTPLRSPSYQYGAPARPLGVTAE